ncbi:enoyl-CoA hydratase/isomerase family protein [Aeromicrobium wangtongii]|uniref:enoyl-CoA hydratase/isomerase family protein n=1 Tax=Aeromicrobium wangtongii TaxID=2969247 RepID=UPI002017EFFF|nr:enoyl-CoA hydratase/isomerase family protein [Aeromicrobium wangtongii]MCL3819859.1 enoyl-CoA hydratase/isomerase family protein [Aeromicrobium wangtongii]
MITGVDRRITMSVADRVASVVLAGRGGVNAMDMRFVEELDEAAAELTALAARREIDVVVLRARGRHFCVGGDLDDMTSAPDVAAHIEVMTGHAHRGIEALHRLPIPLVVGVQGAVAGAGLGLLLAGDIVVAERSARFVGSYGAAGLSPDAGVSWALPRSIGRARAVDMILTNRKVSAEEMERWGLVSRLVDDGDLDLGIAEVVGTLSAIWHDVLLQNKRLLTYGGPIGLHDQLADEAGTIGRLAAARDTMT